MNAGIILQVIWLIECKVQIREVLDHNDFCMNSLWVPFCMVNINDLIIPYIIHKQQRNKHYKTRQVSQYLSVS